MVRQILEAKELNYLVVSRYLIGIIKIWLLGCRVILGTSKTVEVKELNYLVIIYYLIVAIKIGNVGSMSILGKLK